MDNEALRHINRWWLNLETSMKTLITDDDLSTPEELAAAKVILEVVKRNIRKE